MRTAGPAPAVLWSVRDRVVGVVDAYVRAQGPGPVLDRLLDAARQC
ncbi:hypothetical protein ACI79P_11875 [Blastococcus sp. SYSU DS0510]